MGGSQQQAATQIRRETTSSLRAIYSLLIPGSLALSGTALAANTVKYLRCRRSLLAPGWRKKTALSEAQTGARGNGSRPRAPRGRRPSSSSEEGVWFHGFTPDRRENSTFAALSTFLHKAVRMRRRRRRGWKWDTLAQVPAHLSCIFFFLNCLFFYPYFHPLADPFVFRQSEDQSTAPVSQERRILPCTGTSATPFCVHLPAED